MQGTKSNSYSYEKHSHFKVFDFNCDGRDEFCSFEETRVEKSRKEKKRLSWECLDYQNSEERTKLTIFSEENSFFTACNFIEVVTEVIELAVVERQKCNHRSKPRKKAALGVFGLSPLHDTDQ